MTYQCKDCSYSKRAPFPSGSCPACGSFNIQRDNSDTLSPKEGGKRWRLWISIGLWTVLAYLIYEKF